MSQDEYHKMKLKEVSEDKEGLKEKLIDQNFDMSKVKDYEIEDGYLDNKDYIYIRGSDKLFKVLEHYESKDGYFSNISINDDGIIDFDCCFYNGGTYVEEVLENKLKEKEN